MLGNAEGQVIETLALQRAVAGEDVTLSTDQPIQFATFRALRDAVERANEVSAIWAAQKTGVSSLRGRRGLAGRKPLHWSAVERSNPPARIRSCFVTIRRPAMLPATKRTA